MTASEIEWNGGPARLLSLAVKPEPAEAAPVGDALERRRLDGIKAEFTRRFSHELRNTLATIKTAVFCLKEQATGPLSQSQARLIDMIARNADRQARVFDKLADVGRFDAGKLNFEFRRLDLGQILEEFTRDSAFRSGPIHVEFRPEPPLPLVKGDPDLLLQALRNLLDNAVRFAKSKVVIRAGADPAGGVRVSVEDDGEGIPKEKLHELFTPFSKLDTRVNGEAYKGALGLTMCREIIEGHGGRIWAESDEKGSRFYFSLPQFRPLEAAPGQAQRAMLS
jgi:signal transduction histidine kinase